MSTTSPAEATLLVEGIADKYGWLSESERELARPSALKAIANLQNVLGAAARTLAVDLYQSNARFVFELIQNAEDNSYSYATATNVDPYINFSIYPDKIVVENNEDGFTAVNVESICKIAESTKIRTGEQYYIGEKGIGFKSVFMVASKVYIHSGPFSFYFEHPSHGDASGMGMITPVYFRPDEALEGSITRITLMLRTDIDHEELEKQFFHDLPKTLLLFLKKLKRITVNKYDSTATLSRHNTYTYDCDDLNRRATLTQVTQTGGKSPVTSLTRYYTTKSQVSNLPDHSQRDYNTAEIVLAFPVDGKDIPEIGSQDVYAYLPIRSLGFPFLIQSDFITQANRQDVVDCARNRAILAEVARAFVNSVLHFCKHPTLRYQWMRYLPGFQFDPFWGSLLLAIQKILDNTPVLYSHNHVDLRLIRQLRITPDEFKYFGEPLFTDSQEGTYIASEYQKGPDIGSLMSLGLQHLQVVDVIERVQQDLASPSSKFKSKTTQNRWHIHASKFLLRFLDGGCIPPLRKLKCIPLNNGEFTSAASGGFGGQGLGAVHFPDTNRVQIPTDLGLRLVQPSAVKPNSSRKKLLSELGVTDAWVPIVRNSIFKRYDNQKSREMITSLDSIQHLHYLYHTHQIVKSKKEKSLSSTISKIHPFGSELGRNGRTPAEASIADDAPSPTRISSSKPTGDNMLLEPAPSHSREFGKQAPATGGGFGTSLRASPGIFGVQPSSSSSSGVNGARSLGFGIFGANPSAAHGNLGSSSGNSAGGLGYQASSSFSAWLGSSSTANTPSGFGGSLSSISSSAGKSISPFTETKPVVTAPDVFARMQRDPLQCHSPFGHSSYEELRREGYTPIRSEYETLWVFNDLGLLVPCRSDVYFPSKGKFDVQALLEPLLFDNNKPSASILSLVYFQSTPEKSCLEEQSWKAWLHEALGVLKEPRLVNPSNPTELSDIFTYISMSRPEKLIGTLKTHWKTYVELLTPGLIIEISRLEVPCKNGKMVELEDVFLPGMEPSAQRFLRGDENLNFLAHDPHSNVEEWQFLGKFGAHATEDLEFYLALLGRIVSVNKKKGKLTSPEKIFELYEAIYDKWQESNNQTTAGERIRSFFESNACLYGPQRDLGSTWFTPSSCRRDGPRHMKRAISLSDEQRYVNNPALVGFLQKTLQVRTVDWRLLLKELEWKKYTERKDAPEILDIYQRLSRCLRKATSDEQKKIRDRFHDSELIFALPDKWLSPEKCIWYENGQIKGRVNLYPQYDLRRFLVGFLEIQVPDVGMLVSELKSVATSTKSVETAKKLILDISALGPSKTELKTLWKYAIYPVRVGNQPPQLRKRDRDFAIVDRERLSRALQGPVVKGALAVLDFLEIEDVRRLRDFIVACGIEDRYLSDVVEETSAVPGRVADLLEPDPSLTSSLRRRAHALFRCALHWQRASIGDDLESSYQLLFKSQIFVTDQVVTDLGLLQNGEWIYSILDKSDKSALYILRPESSLSTESDDSGLKIYVPKDAKDRQLCYRRILPAKLLGALLEDVGANPCEELDHRTLDIFADVLNCSEDIIDDILDEAGIFQVAFADEYSAESMPSIPDTKDNPDAGVAEGFRNLGAADGALALDGVLSVAMSALTLTTHPPSPRAISCE